MRYAAIALGLALAAGDAAATVQIPVVCGRTAEMIRNLHVKYHERPLAWRTAGDGVVLHLWGNPQGDITGIEQSWTIVAHRNNGISCVLASGKDLPDWAADLMDVRL